MTLTENIDLSDRNTLGLASRARYGGRVSEVREILPMAEFARGRGLPFHLIGAGSNCVLDEQIDAVVGLMDLRGRSLQHDSEDWIRMTACAGESWPELVAWTVEQGVGGLENLAGIPGTVGAAPVQNIGAYGVEIGDIVESVTAVDTITGSFRRFAREECRFTYRNSRFKEERGRYVLIEVTLSLPRLWKPVLSYSGLAEHFEEFDPRTVMDRVLALRHAKLPDWRVTGNVGSFFHNPIVPSALEQQFQQVPRYPVQHGIKLSAGWLIEACGLKGHRCGGAGFYDRHALVIVNHGHATFRDVTRLAAVAVEEVKSRFGVELVQEPVTLA